MRTQHSRLQVPGIESNAARASNGWWSLKPVPRQRREGTAKRESNRQVQQVQFKECVEPLSDWLLRAILPRNREPFQSK